MPKTGNTQGIKFNINPPKKAENRADRRVRVVVFDVAGAGALLVSAPAAPDVAIARVKGAVISIVDALASPPKPALATSVPVMLVASVLMGVASGISSTNLFAVAVSFCGAAFKINSSRSG